MDNYYLSDPHVCEFFVDGKGGSGTKVCFNLYLEIRAFHPKIREFGKITNSKHFI